MVEFPERAKHGTSSPNPPDRLSAAHKASYSMDTEKFLLGGKAAAV